MSPSDWRTKCFYRVSLKAVIYDTDGKVLMVKEKNNPSWNLPGGGMDYGESERQALTRELKEEVGYDGDFTFRALGTWPHFLGGDKQAWQLWIVYHVTPDNFNFSVGGDSNEIDFRDPHNYEDDRRPIYKFAMLALKHQ